MTKPVVTQEETLEIAKKHLRDDVLTRAFLEELTAFANAVIAAKFGEPVGHVHKNFKDIMTRNGKASIFPEGHEHSKELYTRKG